MMNEDLNKSIEGGTIQKYCLIYMGDAGLTYEVFDFKQHLRKRLKEVDRTDVRIIMKGRPLKIKVEERLTV